MKKVLTVVGSVVVALTVAISAYANFSFAQEDIMCEEVALQEAVLEGFETKIPLSEDEVAEILECIEKDRELIDETAYSGIGWGFQLKMICDEVSDDEYAQQYIRDYYIDVQHVNTIEWVKTNGYWDDLALDTESAVYIIKNPLILPYMDFWDSAIELDMDYYEVVETISGEKVKDVCEYAYTHAVDTETLPEDRYLVYQEATPGAYRYMTTLSEVQLAELMG